MKIKFVFLIISVTLLSCREKVVSEYYETGELKNEKITYKGNDSIIYIKEYFKNGFLKQEGLIKNDSLMIGRHKWYFADGKMLWEGDIKNSVIQDNYKWNWHKCPNCFQGIEIEGNPHILIHNKDYKFRIIMPHVNPRFYSAVDSKYKNLNNPDKNSVYTFPYLFNFRPNESGEYIIRIVFMNKDGYFAFGDPHIEFTIYENMEYTGS